MGSHPVRAIPENVFALRCLCVRACLCVAQVCGQVCGGPHMLSPQGVWRVGGVKNALKGSTFQAHSVSGDLCARLSVINSQTHLTFVRTTHTSCGQTKGK